MTKDRQIELIQKLADIFEELEWLVAIPLNESDTCEGLIVGEHDFVTNVTKAYYGEDAEIITPNSKEGPTEPNSIEVEAALDDNETPEESYH